MKLSIRSLLSSRMIRSTIVVLAGLSVYLGFHTLQKTHPKRARAARTLTSKANGPNILIIVGDDHAADTLGVDGDQHGATPRIDALARQGVYFRRAYCNSPLCTPSRQSFITGKLPHAIGVTRLQTALPATAVTLGDWLDDRGYATAAVGKMHFNSRNLHGFDDRFDTQDWTKFLSAHPPKLGHHLVPFKPFKDATKVWLNADYRPAGLLDESMEATYMTGKASEFIRRHKDEPYAMVVGFYEPHSPFRFPDDWPKRFQPSDFTVPPVSDADRRVQPKVFKTITPQQTQGIQASYYQSISYLDSKVGQVLDALDASGQAANTIVVYLGDNGYLRGDHGRFEKHCFYERAVRVPLIIRWPNHIPAGKQITGLVELVDLMPTILELAEVAPPKDLQGRSLVKLMNENAGQAGRKYVFSEYLENEEAMLSDGRFKLITGTGRRARQDGYETDDPTPGPYERLYDLENDSNENIDLAIRPGHETKIKELRGALLDRLTTTRNPTDQPPKGLSELETIHWCLVPKD